MTNVIRLRVSGKVSNVKLEDLERVISFVSELEDHKYDPMFPWHIGRAIRNRVAKTDDDEEQITVNNSHMRMIINGVLRMVDEEDIDEETKDSMENIHSIINKDSQ